MTEDPARFGRWTVLDQLGQGGMGVVWRAVDPAGRLAAVKVARGRATAREALRREVEALERLRHPGLVRFLEHGATEDGALWVATELVEGRALRAHLHETHPSTASNAPPRAGPSRRSGASSPCSGGCATRWPGCTERATSTAT